MASKVLPQALILAINSNSVQSHAVPRKLGFSISDVNSRGIYPSRVSLSQLRFNLSPIVAVSARNSFAVRSEAGNDGEPEVIESAEGESEGASSEITKESAENLEQVAVSEGESEPKPSRKPRIKLGEIMGILNQRAIEASEQQRPVPDIRTGDIVEIKLEVPENRKRLSVYKGIVISKQNAGVHTTIRIRRIIAGVGVEIVFPLYSPNIKEIKVVSHRKVRKARLYYLRDKLPRLSTFK